MDGDAYELGPGDWIHYSSHPTHLAIEVDGTPFEVGPGDALHGDRPRSITWTVTSAETATSIWAAAAREGGARAEGH